MGNQNTHLDRHSRSVSDLREGGTRSARHQPDNVSLMSVDAVLTSYERRAFGELEREAEADYRDIRRRADSPPDVAGSLSGIREESLDHDMEDDIGDSSDLMMDDNNGLEVKPTHRANHELPDNRPDNMSDNGNTEHSGAQHSLNNEAARWQEWEARGDSASEEEEEEEKVDNEKQNMDTDSGNQATHLSLEDTDQIQNNPHSLSGGDKSHSDESLGEDPPPAHMSAHASSERDPTTTTTEDSEDEVFSGMAESKSDSSPLVRSRPVSIDDLLDSLQETAVDEVQSKASGAKRKAEVGSESPSPPPVPLSPPPDSSVYYFDASDPAMAYIEEINLEDYHHLHPDINRTEPRSEPVTDLDDDSEDDDLHSSLYSGLGAGDSGTQGAITDLLLEMQHQFGDVNNENNIGQKSEDDADTDGSLSPGKPSGSVSSGGGEYDTATMKIKREFSDSDSSDENTSSDEEHHSEKRASKRRSRIYSPSSSSSEDEIIQHLTPEMIDKVINNADDEKVDLYEDEPRDEEKDKENINGASLPVVTEPGESITENDKGAYVEECPKGAHSQGDEDVTDLTEERTEMKVDVLESLPPPEVLDTMPEVTDDLMTETLNDDTPSPNSGVKDSDVTSGESAQPVVMETHEQDVVLRIDESEHSDDKTPNLIEVQSSEEGRTSETPSDITVKEAQLQGDLSEDGGEGEIEGHPDDESQEEVPGKEEEEDVCEEILSDHTLEDKDQNTLSGGEEAVFAIQTEVVTPVLHSLVVISETNNQPLEEVEIVSQTTNQESTHAELLTKDEEEEEEEIETIQVVSNVVSGASDLQSEHDLQKAVSDEESGHEDALDSVVTESQPSEEIVQDSGETEVKEMVATAVVQEEKITLETISEVTMATPEETIVPLVAEDESTSLQSSANLPQGQSETSDDLDQSKFENDGIQSIKDLESEVTVKEEDKPVTDTEILAQGRVLETPLEVISFKVKEEDLKSDPESQQEVPKDIVEVKVTETEGHSSVTEKVPVVTISTEDESHGRVLAPIHEEIVNDTGRKRPVSAPMPDVVPMTASVQAPDYHGYSNKLLQVIKKKYPMIPPPKEPEKLKQWERMRDQIKHEIDAMLKDDTPRMYIKHAGQSKRTPVPSGGVTMETHVPAPSSRRPPPSGGVPLNYAVPSGGVPTKNYMPPGGVHPQQVGLPPSGRSLKSVALPGGVPPPGAPSGALPLPHTTQTVKKDKQSRKELKRRESEKRKLSKKVKKKDKKGQGREPEKESESRMAQLANFIKLGSLSKEHASKTEPRREERREEERPEHHPEHPPTHATAPIADYVVQRSVVIRRDEKGYGLTVSGDNPVFVQSVKENGAAVRVGVQEGDRIIKVNGTLVTNSNHVEVVKLIKSGPYVALTLLGRPPGSQSGKSDGPSGPTSTPSSPPGSERITGPQPVDDPINKEYHTQKIALTRMMYEAAANQLESMKSERNPSDAELNDKQRTLRKLENALFQLTGIPAESHLPGGPKHKPHSVSDFFESDRHPDTQVARSQSDSRKRDCDSHKATSLPTGGGDMDHVSPTTSPLPLKDHWSPDQHISDSNEDIRDSGPLDHEAVPSIIPMMPTTPKILDAEDFTSEEEGQADDHGPFSDLNVLKHKPSHLAVFLNYLISNSDPSPLLFYLVTEDYSKGNMKEMKKWAYEIHSTFLLPKSPLRVNVEESILANINNALQIKQDKVDALTTVFSYARHFAQNEIGELLADFRNKCALGLGSLYGTHELKDEGLDKSLELQLVEKCIGSHFMRLHECEHDSDRNQALACALATFLKQVGCTLSGKQSTILERCPTFVAKDKKNFTSKFKQKRTVVKEHSFNLQHCTMLTLCHHCSGALWGVAPQGLICQHCEITVHKHCVDQEKEVCRSTKKPKRSSSLMYMISRKQSANNPPATPTHPRERWLEEGYTSPSNTTAASGHARTASRDDDEDEEHLRSARPVSQLLEQYGGAGARQPEENKSPGSPRSRSPEPVSEDHERKHVVRSESLKNKSETVSKTVRRSRSDLHVDDPSVKATLNQSGSDTSITGSLESPSNSNEVLNDLSIHPKHAASHHDDSDLDVENELPPTGIPGDQVKKLKPKEKKRQDVINEFIHTERTHVRNLKVMQRVFYQPMEAFVSRDLMKLLFPNLEEVNQIHNSLCKSFRARKKENPQVAELGDLLLNRFDGEAGGKMRTACAMFCRNQAHALETLRVRQRKDQKLQIFLQEATTNPLCRRLELKDLLVTVMQRLTKYPLLIENLMKYTQSATAEYERLQQALQCSRDILSYVNEAVKECENHQKLVEIQRRLDKKAFENSSLPIVSEYKNLDLTHHRMIYHGPLTWRIARSKQIELHVVLLEEILVLLQKQDDKYVLKCNTTVVTGRDDTKYTHSPIIKLTNLLTRNVAVDKRAFFLVCTSDIGPQIYELHAMSKEEKNKWLRYITEAAEHYKIREQARVQTKDTAEPSTAQEGKQSEEAEPERKTSKDEVSDVEGLEQQRCSSVDSLENMGKMAVHHTNQAELIQPNEVVISDTVLEEAEPILSPKEVLRRKDKVVRQALEDKQRSVAQLLNVPYAQYAHIAEMASELEGDKDTRELVLASIHQATKLTDLVNTSLSVLEEEEQEEEEEMRAPNTPIYGASAGKFDDRSVVMVTLPSDHVLDITKKFNEQLTNLLDRIKSYEDEKQQLQTDLDHAHEQLRLARDTPARSPTNSCSRHSRPNSFASITSSTSEVGESGEDAQTYTQNDDTGVYFSTSPRAATASSSAVFELQKLEIVESEPESDDANHNVSQDALHTTSCDTDANLNQRTEEKAADTGETSDQENIGTSF